MRKRTMRRKKRNWMMSKRGRTIYILLVLFIFFIILPIVLVK